MAFTTIPPETPVGGASDNKKDTGQCRLGGSVLKMEVPGNGLLFHVNAGVHFLYLIFRIFFFNHLNAFQSLSSHKHNITFPVDISSFPVSLFY